MTIENAKKFIEKARAEGSVRVHGEFDLMRGDHMIAEAKTWAEFDEDENPIDTVKKYDLREENIYLWGNGLCKAVDAEDLANEFADYDLTV
jgi:hypothetical protein